MTSNLTLFQMDCREETKKTLEEMKTLVVDVAKDSLNEYNTLISNLGKIELPDFQRVFDYYKQEGEVMYGELMNDPDFKKISELL